MGRTTHSTTLLKAIKVELVQCERRCWRLDEKLLSSKITTARKDELSQQRAELQAKILSLLGEIDDLGRAEIVQGRLADRGA